MGLSNIQPKKEQQAFYLTYDIIDAIDQRIINIQKNAQGSEIKITVNKGTIVEAALNECLTKVSDDDIIKFYNDINEENKCKFFVRINEELIFLIDKRVRENKMRARKSNVQSINKSKLMYCVLKKYFEEKL